MCVWCDTHNIQRLLAETALTELAPKWRGILFSVQYELRSVILFRRSLWFKHIRETLGDLQLLLARLLGKNSTYPEAPATGHLETDFLPFPVSSSKYSDGSPFKTATASFSRSKPKFRGSCVKPILFKILMSISCYFCHKDEQAKPGNLPAKWCSFFSRIVAPPSTPLENSLTPLNDLVFRTFFCSFPYVLPIKLVGFLQSEKPLRPVASKFRVLPHLSKLTALKTAHP